MVGFTALGGVLFFLRDVLAPFAMALFLNVLFTPIIQNMQKRGFPKSIAIGTTFLISGVLLSITMVVVASSLSQLLSHAEAYQARFAELFWELLYSIPDAIGKHLDVETSFGFVTSGIQTGLSTLTSIIVGLMSQSLVVGLFLVFFLLSEREISTRSPMIADIEHKVRDYMTVKVILSTITAVLTGSLLSLAGVDLALVFALLAFLLNFIPNIGSILAVAFPFPILVLTPGLTFRQSMVVLFGLVIIQFVIGNLVEPKLIGNKLDMDPVLVLFSLLLWGAMWGIIGAILAVPITATLKALILNQAHKPDAELIEPVRETNHLEETKPLEEPDLDEPV